MCKCEIYMDWNDISMKNEYWSGWWFSNVHTYIQWPLWNWKPLYKLLSIRNLNMWIREYCIQVDYIHRNIQIPVWLTSYRIQIDKMLIAGFHFIANFEPFLISLHLNKLIQVLVRCPLERFQTIKLEHTIRIENAMHTKAIQIHSWYEHIKQRLRCK